MLMSNSAPTSEKTADTRPFGATRKRSASAGWLLVKPLIFTRTAEMIPVPLTVMAEG
jgi:hypothetical protein